MEEVKDKNTIEKLKNMYINLITCKNAYVIQGNFDYLKDNNLLCIPIFGIENFIKRLVDFLNKRNQKDFYITQTHFVKERGGLVVDFFYTNKISYDNMDSIMETLNITEYIFYFSDIKFFIAFNDFDYYLIIAKQEDIEELTNLTIPELLEYTKEIDWYSDDRPEMYDTYKKFLEDVGVIKK